MRLHSWLSNLAQALSVWNRRSRIRGSRKRKYAESMLVERLEPRRLLSVAPVGLEMPVNTFTTGSQAHSDTAIDAAGNYVITWQSDAQDGDGYGIYAQRYSAAGVVQGTEFRVNSFTTGDQVFPSIAMDATGDFAITWRSQVQDGSGFGIYAQRYNAGGIAQGSEFRVNSTTTNDQNSPSISMDTAGDFVVTWQSYGQDGSHYGIYAQRYNATGVAQGSEFKANTFTTSVQRDPTVALDATGDFVITWSSYTQDGSAAGIYARRYNASGVAQGSEFRVNTYTTSFQGFPAVAMDGAGDFVITWQSLNQDGGGYGIYAQRYNAAGTTQGGEFQVNTFTTGDQDHAAIALDSAGDFVISWHSSLDLFETDGVYAQSYSATGAAQGSELRVNTFTAGVQSFPSLAMNAKGDLVTSWTSVGQDGSANGIEAQSYQTTAGPIVMDVLEGTGPRVIQNGDKIVSTVKQLTVEFSDTLNTTNGSAKSVLNPLNWSLFRNSADVSDLISGFVAGFNVSGNRFFVTISFVQPLTSGTYSLVARQSIQNLTGQSLDGEADGLPGGNFRCNFSVATTLPAGAETHVNTFTTNHQSEPSIATDATGDYVVTWESFGQLGDSDGGIFAQRYNSTGLAQGSEFRVNTFTTGPQALPTVAMNGAGSFVIAWASKGQDGDNYGIYAQRYTAAGVAQGNEFKVNTYTTDRQNLPSVAMDAAGDFVIAWCSNVQDQFGYGIYARRYNSSGVAQGNEFQVNTWTTDQQTNPTVAMDAAGDFVIAWQSMSQDLDVYGIYAQRYGANGTRADNEFQVNTTTLGAQILPAAAMDASGNFVIGWQSDDGDGSIYARRFAADGTAADNEFLVSHYTASEQTNVAVAMDAVGDFAITWDRQQTTQNGVFAQRYNSAGVVQSGRDVFGDRMVIDVKDGDQTLPEIAMDPAGDFIITWTSTRNAADPGFGIFSQRFQADVAPVLSNVELTPLSAAASLFTPVTSTLLAFDQDSNTWAGATVQISSHYQNGQDVLAFTNQLGITGSFDAATGTLTLSGTSSVSNYRTALRSVTYHNTSASPNISATRTIEFQANDGLLYSNFVTRDLTVLATSVPAVLSGVSGTGTYSENAPNLVLAAGLVISEPDSVNLASATVSFTGWQSEDRVDFNNIFALQHTFVQDLVAHTATFTITGISTVDHYQTLLRSVVYSDVSDAPNTSTRIASFRVSDGLSNSNVVVRNTVVSPVNDAPKLSAIETTPLVYKANDPAFPAQPISAALLVADADSNNLTKATVQITAGYQNDANGHDVLAFTNQLGITGSFNATTGTLTLTGTSGAGNYRTALRSVTFSSSGAAVSLANRTFAIIGTDDFSPTPAVSLAITRIISVSTSNIPPALTGIPSTPLTYARGTAATTVASGLFVLDNDSINLISATIQVTGNYQNGQDILAATSGSGISAAFNTANGTLTLSGLSSLANYQTVLRSVTYKTNSAGATTATRTLTFLLNDGLTTSTAVTRSITLT